MLVFNFTILVIRVSNMIFNILEKPVHLLYLPIYRDSIYSPTVLNLVMPVHSWRKSRPSRTHKLLGTFQTIVKYITLIRSTTARKP